MTADKPCPHCRGGPSMKPDPVRISRHGQAVVKLVTDHGVEARQMADLLASRGYPTSTLGDGGARNSDQWSSTERAALNPDPHWDNINTRLDRALQAWFVAGSTLHSLVTDILAHAQTTGLRPTGTGAGECAACGEWVSGTPNDRLRSGFCHTDYTAWVRAGRPDRAVFTRERRAHHDGIDIDERLNPGRGNTGNAA